MLKAVPAQGWRIRCGASPVRCQSRVWARSRYQCQRKDDRRAATMPDLPGVDASHDVTAAIDPGAVLGSGGSVGVVMGAVLSKRPRLLPLAQLRISASSVTHP